MMNIVFIFLRRDINGTYVSDGKVNPIHLFNIYAPGFKELCQRDIIFFKVYYLSDLPLIAPCKGLVGVKSFCHLGCYLFDMYLYAHSVKHVLGINYGEDISVGSIMSLFHLLPVKVLLFFCVCLPVFWLLVQHSSWNRLH